MSSGKRILIFALLIAAIYGLIALATVLNSPWPLFFAWVPPAAMMWVEKRFAP